MKLKASLVVSAVTLLAACGGGSSGTSNEPTIQPVQQNLLNGRTLSAPEETHRVIRLDYENRTTSLATAKSMSLSIPSNGLLALTNDGETFIFTEEHAQRNDDGSIAGFVISEVGGNYAQVYGAIRPISDIYDPEKEHFAVLIDYMSITPDAVDDGQFGFAVVGTKTPTSALGAFSSESFGGRFSAEILPSQYPQTGQTGRADREMLDGQAQVLANFSNNSIQLVLNNPRYRVHSQHDIISEETVEGNLTFAQGTISGSSFAGSFDFSQSEISFANLQQLSGSYSGAFFGPNAEAVGATFSGIGLRSGSEMTFAGGVEAAR